MNMESNETYRRPESGLGEGIIRDSLNDLKDVIDEEESIQNVAESSRDNIKFRDKSYYTSLMMKREDVLAAAEKNN